MNRRTLFKWMVSAAACAALPLKAIAQYRAQIDFKNGLQITNPKFRGADGWFFVVDRPWDHDADHLTFFRGKFRVTYVLGGDDRLRFLEVDKNSRMHYLVDRLAHLSVSLYKENNGVANIKYQLRIMKPWHSQIPFTIHVLNGEDRTGAELLWDARSA